MKKEIIIASIALGLQVIVLGLSGYLSYLYYIKLQTLKVLDIQAILKAILEVNQSTKVAVIINVFSLPALALYIVSVVFAFRLPKKTIGVILIIGFFINVLKIVGLILLIIEYNKKNNENKKAPNEDKEIYLYKETKE